MEKIIRERTLNGQFARQGSSGARARVYNPDYARQVGKSPGGPVNLFLSGGMLGAMKGAFTFRNDQGSVGMKSSGDMEVFIRFTTESARRLANIHNKLGSGRSRIKRRFLFLNAQERRRVLRLGVQTLTGNR